MTEVSYGIIKQESLVIDYVVTFEVVINGSVHSAIIINLQCGVWENQLPLGFAGPVWLGYQSDWLVAGPAN